ncbi:MAG: aminotransferase class IV [Brevundimonas sp.]|uniref:aminotransferase class IV n=1 Tax=Brevundimonas sp. TaxID=1871086 RepID=UPI0027356AD1|nr:aminotransferase class IV [Brevundimonas sp.]MDP3378874.1 aminotransferase class IV [Brevundimonas sp.]
MATAELWIDGAPATVEDLTHQALINYGAYTSFAVAGGAVRGLDRHLARLTHAGHALFGAAVPEAEVRTLIRQAMGDRSDAFVRVSLFSREISPRSPAHEGRPGVMVGVFPPVPPLGETPLRLQVQTYARETPDLKHVATMGLIRARRQARVDGYDDALFVDSEGRISEGSLWNIGFLCGDRVIWPEAPMLEGVSQALITAHLADVGLKQETQVVTVDAMSGFDGAFITNSATPACAVGAIGDHAFAGNAEGLNQVVAAWSRAEPQPV